MILYSIVALLSIVVIVLTYTTVNLLKKNEKLEGVLDNQFNMMAIVRDLIKESSTKLNELDKNGAFKSDDEIGWFFNNISYVQNVLSELLSTEDVKKETKG